MKMTASEIEYADKKSKKELQEILDRYTIPTKALRIIGNKITQITERGVSKIKQRTEEPGLRYDAEKSRYDLISADALEVLAQVYTIGAAKYADRNWEKGMSWSRCFASLMRHAWAFWRGENLDPETHLPHMAHVAWNAFALMSYATRNTGTDDRPK